MMDMQAAYKLGKREGRSKSGHQSQPFSLGLPGEKWNDELGYLEVPVHHTGKVILVGAASDFRTYTVVTLDNWRTVDSALMAAALVHGVLRAYLSR